MEKKKKDPEQRTIALVHTIYIRGIFFSLLFLSASKPASSFGKPPENTYVFCCLLILE